MKNTLIQIHTLTGYNSVLLNRDDSGMAKRIEFGPSVRTRTSSQFAKRKLRLAEGENSVSALGEMSVRSRLTFRRMIAEPLIEHGIDKDVVVAVTMAVMDAVYGVSKKAEEKRSKSKDDEMKDPLESLERGELVILGKSEIDYLKSVIEGICKDSADAKDAASKAEVFVKDKDVKANLRELGQSNKALDIAMFGRMVTGDALSSVDAAVHVAHAITVHGQQSEVDFFTAVDDLKTDHEDSGSAHMGEAEINSPLLYGYYVVDFNQLLDNLKGLDNARDVAARLVANLVKLTATSVVGAKKGSTAPYSTSDFVMVEVGHGANRSLAEAFRKPVAPTIEAAVGAIEKYVNAKDAMYGVVDGQRMTASIVEHSISNAKSASLPDMAVAVEKALKA